MNWEDYEVVQHLKGTDMEYMVAKHPYIEGRESLLMEAVYVTAEDGTGLVHTASGFGEDDYNTAMRYGFKVLSPMDAKGCFTEEIPD